MVIIYSCVVNLLILWLCMPASDVNEWCADVNGGCCAQVCAPVMKKPGLCWTRMELIVLLTMSRVTQKQGVVVVRIVVPDSVR